MLNFEVCYAFLCRYHSFYFLAVSCHQVSFYTGNIKNSNNNHIYFIRIAE